MGSPGKSADRIEALRSILDRLCAPDLTLSEAKQLVPSLSTILESEAPSVDHERDRRCRSRSTCQDF